MGTREGITRAARALSLTVFILAAALPRASHAAGDLIAGGIGGTGLFQMNDGNIIIDPGLNFTFSGTITGTGKVIKRGAGSQTFMGDFSSYSGGTYIEGGTFIVDNPFGAPVGPGIVQVSAGATLAGSGGTRGLLTILPGGILSPGSSINSFEAGGGLDLRAGSILKMDIGRTASDRIIVDGGNLIAHDVILQLAARPLPLADGESTTILDWTNALAYDISADRFTLDPNGLHGYLRIPDGTRRLEFVVPEPGLCAIGALAAIFCLPRRRSRR
jgi:autotransporter-associated beta strand protein